MIDDPCLIINTNSIYSFYPINNTASIKHATITVRYISTSLLDN